MNCQFCEGALSGLAAGFVSLISFVVMPMMQILWATLKLIFEKIR